MPLPSQKTLLREYPKWNRHTRKRLEVPIKIVYGEDFVAILERITLETKNMKKSKKKADTKLCSRHHRQYVAAPARTSKHEQEGDSCERDDQSHRSMDEGGNDDDSSSSDSYNGPSKKPLKKQSLKEKRNKLPCTSRKTSPNAPEESKGIDNKTEKHSQKGKKPKQKGSRRTPEDLQVIDNKTEKCSRKGKKPKQKGSRRTPEDLQGIDNKTEKCSRKGKQPKQKGRSRSPKELQEIDNPSEKCSRKGKQLPKQKGHRDGLRKKRKRSESEEDGDDSELCAKMLKLMHKDETDMKANCSNAQKSTRKEFHDNGETLKLNKASKKVCVKGGINMVNIQKLKVLDDENSSIGMVETKPKSDDAYETVCAKELPQLKEVTIVVKDMAGKDSLCKRGAVSGDSQQKKTFLENQTRKQDDGQIKDSQSEQAAVCDSNDKKVPTKEVAMATLTKDAKNDNMSQDDVGKKTTKKSKKSKKRKRRPKKSKVTGLEKTHEELIGCEAKDHVAQAIIETKQAVGSLKGDLDGNDKIIDEVGTLSNSSTKEIVQNSGTSSNNGFQRLNVVEQSVKTSGKKSIANGSSGGSTLLGVVEKIYSQRAQNKKQSDLSGMKDEGSIYEESCELRAQDRKESDLSGMKDGGSIDEEFCQPRAQNKKESDLSGMRDGRLISEESCELRAQNKKESDLSGLKDGGSVVEESCQLRTQNDKHLDLSGLKEERSIVEESCQSRAESKKQADLDGLKDEGSVIAKESGQPNCMEIQGGHMNKSTKDGLPMRGKIPGLCEQPAWKDIDGQVAANTCNKGNSEQIQSSELSDGERSTQKVSNQCILEKQSFEEDNKSSGNANQQKESERLEMQSVTNMEDGRSVSHQANKQLFEEDTRQEMEARTLSETQVSKGRSMKSHARVMNVSRVRQKGIMRLSTPKSKKFKKSNKNGSPEYQKMTEVVEMSSTDQRSCDQDCTDNEIEIVGKGDGEGVSEEGEIDVVGIEQKQIDDNHLKKDIALKRDVGFTNETNKSKSVNNLKEDIAQKGDVGFTNESNTFNSVNNWKEDILNKGGDVCPQNETDSTSNPLSIHKLSTSLEMNLDTQEQELNLLDLPSDSSEKASWCDSDDGSSGSRDSDGDSFQHELEFFSAASSSNEEDSSEPTKKDVYLVRRYNMRKRERKTSVSLLCDEVLPTEDSLEKLDGVLKNGNRSIGSQQNSENKELMQQGGINLSNENSCIESQQISKNNDHLACDKVLPTEDFHVRLEGIDKNENRPLESQQNFKNDEPMLRDALSLSNENRSTESQQNSENNEPMQPDTTRLSNKTDTDTDTDEKRPRETQQISETDNPLQQDTSRLSNENRPTKCQQNSESIESMQQDALSLSNENRPTECQQNSESIESMQQRATGLVKETSTPKLSHDGITKRSSSMPRFNSSFVPKRLSFEKEFGIKAKLSNLSEDIKDKVGEEGMHKGNIAEASHDNGSDKGGRHHGGVSINRFQDGELPRSRNSMQQYLGGNQKWVPLSHSTPYPNSKPVTFSDKTEEIAHPEQEDNCSSSKQERGKQSSQSRLQPEAGLLIDDASGSAASGIDKECMDSSKACRSELQPKDRSLKDAARSAVLRIDKECVDSIKVVMDGNIPRDPICPGTKHTSESMSADGIILGLPSKDQNKDVASNIVCESNEVPSDRMEAAREKQTKKRKWGHTPAGMEGYRKKRHGAKKRVTEGPTDAGSDIQEQREAKKKKKRGKVDAIHPRLRDGSLRPTPQKVDRFQAGQVQASNAKKKDDIASKHQDAPKKQTKYITNASIHLEEIKETEKGENKDSSEAVRVGKKLPKAVGMDKSLTAAEEISKNSPPAEGAGFKKFWKNWRNVAQPSPVKQSSMEKAGTSHVQEYELDLTEKLCAVNKQKSVGSTALSSIAPKKVTDKSPFPDEKYPVGSLVWGKMKGFTWWPARIIHHYESMRRQTPPTDSRWVKWYGDGKFSLLKDDNVAPFHEFDAHFNASYYKRTALYQKALFEITVVAAKRCKNEINPSVTEGVLVGANPKSDEEKEAYRAACKNLLEWVKEGFQPSGPDALVPVEEDKAVPPPPRPRSPSLEPVPSPLKSLRSTPSKSPGKQAALYADHRDQRMEAIKKGDLLMKDMCIGCGEFNLVAEHPLFEGGLCEVCRIELLEVSYLFDIDGYQSYCCVCAEGKEIVLCGEAGCGRSFCVDCLDLLVAPGESQRVVEQDPWVCYMCSPEIKHGLLVRHADWNQRLVKFFQDDTATDYPALRSYPAVPLSDRKPIRVLSLFDGIGTAMLVLKELGFQVECYYASEVNNDAITIASIRHEGNIHHIGDVRDLDINKLQSLGQIDLLIGGSPCNDLSIVNPARKGLVDHAGSGVLFFDFHRVLQEMQHMNEGRPFFWLFENVTFMDHRAKMTISRFLQCNPVMLDAKDLSPAHRARYFWGNIPGMSRPNIAAAENSLKLQDVLERNCNRQAQFTKVRTITTKSNSVKQKKEKICPVMMNGQEDTLWCTEMERIFGFPEHYTDVANLNRTKRHQLLGQAWSVPVIKHLLTPLKDYFSCITQERNSP